VGPKTFCIGFNKTATTSLHNLFLFWGMKSFHGEYQEVSFDDDLFSNYQYFSDGEYHDFRGLDKAFTASKFILSTRRLDDWLLSRIKHVEFRRSCNQTGWMRKEYERDPKAALQNWIRRRATYYHDVQDYFSTRDDDFLKVNICDCPNGKELVACIASFLNMDLGGIQEFPRKNISVERKPTSLSYRFKVSFLGAPIIRSEEAIRDEVHDALRLANVPESEWSSDGFSLC
jgi:hypothetical protein